MSNIPKPSIYLRNRFCLQAAKNAEFLAGKEQLLRSTLRRWKLLAAGGERSVRLGRNLPEPSLRMMQVWELDSWELLYESMYELSEAKWYRELGEAVASEQQELLVNFTSGYGVVARSAWRADDSPGYRYFSEELMLARGATMHWFMRELNWLAAELSRVGVVRTWCARQITGRPGLVCVLWQVPDGVSVEQSLDRIADEARTRERYTRMLRAVGDLTREILHPLYTERLDERIRAGESARIVPRTNDHAPGATGSAAAFGLSLS